MTPPDRQSPPPEGGWESLKVDELKEELEARGLPKSGTKSDRSPYSGLISHGRVVIKAKSATWAALTPPARW